MTTEPLIGNHGRSSDRTFTRLLRLATRAFVSVVAMETRGGIIRLHRLVDCCPCKACRWLCPTSHVNPCFLGNTESCSNVERDRSGATERRGAVAPSLANHPSSDGEGKCGGTGEGCNCGWVCRGRGRHVLASSTTHVLLIPNQTDRSQALSPANSESRRGSRSPPSPPPPNSPSPAEDLSHSLSFLVIPCRHWPCSWWSFCVGRFFVAFIFVSCFVTKRHTSGASEASKHVHVRWEHLLRVQHGHHGVAEGWEGWERQGHGVGSCK